MSDEEDDEMVKAVHQKMLQILVANQSYKQDGGVAVAIGWSKYDLTIQSIIAEHLKLLLMKIIQKMTLYKKKHLLFCQELNGKQDPRMADSGQSSVSSVIAYEKNRFTAKDFLKMLQDDQSLIPNNDAYQRCIERIMSLDSMKPIKPSDDETKQKPAKRLKQN